MSTIKSSAENLTLNADGANNDIKFQSNGVEKASIDQDGNLVLSGTLTSVGVDDNCTATKLTVSDSGININGDITFSSASQGICLGVTSNVDANTLDDYEEGTFTPQIYVDSSHTGVTYSAATGVYTKIGNLVTCFVVLGLSSKGSASGNVTFRNLPFTISNSSADSSLDGGCANWGYWAGTSGINYFTFVGNGGVNYATGYAQTGSTGDCNVTFTNSHITDAFSLRFTFQFLTDL